MKNRIFALSLAVLMVLAFAAPSLAQVTIEYWQYYYESKVKLIDELIKVFEEQNPGIKVEHITFPYDSFNEQVAAAVAAGQGPDVLNIFYGWLPMYLKEGFLQPLPEEYFSVEEIENRFIPMVNAVKVDGRYWALPPVRTWPSSTTLITLKKKGSMGLPRHGMNSSRWPLS